MKKLLLTSTVLLVLSQSALSQQSIIEQELELKRQNLSQPAQNKSTIGSDVHILATVNYVTDTTGGPTWDRPFTVGDGTSGSCSISGSGAGANYSTRPLSVDTTGLYTITSTHSGYDGYLLLYNTALNIADQCVGLIALNDDGNGIGDSIIADINLTSGTSYTIVHGGFDNTEFGVSNVEVSGVGLPTVPVELQNFSID